MDINKILKYIEINKDDISMVEFVMEDRTPFIKVYFRWGAVETIEVYVD